MYEICWCSLWPGGPSFAYRIVVPGNGRRNPGTVSVSQIVRRLRRVRTAGRARARLRAELGRELTGPQHGGLREHVSE